MKNELKIRLITSFSVFPFVVMCFISYKSLVGLVSAVVLLAGYELLTIKFKDYMRFFYLGLLVSYPILYGLFFLKEPYILILSLFLLSSTVTILFVKDISAIFDRIVYPIFGLVYVSCALSFFMPIYKEFGAANALLTLSSVWIFDTCAYFTGMKFGKIRISPKYSPKKSLEGVLGGFLGTFLFSVIYKIIAEEFFKGSVISHQELILFSLIVSIMGTIGDIFESAIKRFFGLKDSGNILPGHGGMLDRIDGLLFVTPAVYIMLRVLKGGIM